MGSASELRAWPELPLSLVIMGGLSFIWAQWVMPYPQDRTEGQNSCPGLSHVHPKRPVWEGRSPPYRAVSPLWPFLGPSPGCPGDTHRQEVLFPRPPAWSLHPESPVSWCRWGSLAVQQWCGHLFPVPCGRR